MAATLFCVDASTQIGLGHLMRCLTLVQALRERGAEVTFVMRDWEGNGAAPPPGECNTG